MIFSNNILRNTKLVLLYFLQTISHYRALWECTCEADIKPKGLQQALWPTWKGIIYVITLSIASNQVLAAQAEFTTHNDMHRFSSQLLSHAPHSGVSVGQKNEEHVNQQENKRKLLLFPILEIKTTAVRGSTCESGICSPQVLLRIHI